MILDLNVYIGTWPFRRLRRAGAANVRRLMARIGISRALAAPLQAVFYKDCLEGVQEMMEGIGAAGDLLPLAMVNPRFPGWERDLRTMVEEWGCVACGLIPHYHGYRVYDSCATALCRKLQELRLPALLFVRLQDERSHHWCMQVPPLAVDDLLYLLKAFPDLPLAICNANLPVEGVALAPALADRAATLLTTAYKSLKLPQMVERLGVQHLAFATGMPLHYPESALFQVRDAGLSDAERQALLWDNAAAFLRLAGSETC